MLEVFNPLLVRFEMTMFCLSRFSVCLSGVVDICD